MNIVLVGSKHFGTEVLSKLIDAPSVTICAVVVSDV